MQEDTKGTGPTPQSPPTQSEISARAYQIYKERIKAQEQHDWERAERELLEQE